MINKSKRLKNLEIKRYSIFTDNFEICYICGRYRTDLHEILYGKNRINSIKWGFVLPLCRNCHQKMHADRALTEYWIKKCQKYFELFHTRDEWIDTFKKNYL